MSAFFIYIFKVCFWITIWWLLYIFFLRKETFFSFNRIYLMTGLAACFLIPLFKIHYPVEIFIRQNPTVIVAENIQTLHKTVDNYTIMFYFYIFCGASFIIGQVFLLTKIYKQIRSSGFTVVDNCRIVDSPDTKIPFSFFNYIFLNFRAIPEQERQLILEHERSHIKQLHWIDLTFADFIRIFLWFNPFVWFYQRSIKENHEFLADEAVIRNGFSPASYRATLINQSLNIPVFQLVNSFANYKFKRISMMKKENSNPLKKLAVLLLLPAAGFFLWAFAEPEYRITTIEDKPQINNFYVLSSDTVIVRSVLSEKDSTSAYVKELNMAINAAASAISGEKTKNGSNESYTKIEKDVNVGDPKNHVSYQVLNNEKAENVVIYRRTPTDSISDVDSLNAHSQQYLTAVSSISQPLILIDGIEADVDALENFKVEHIESFSVLKDALAVAVYGDRGKNGVILIMSKNGQKTPENSFEVEHEGVTIIATLPDDSEKKADQPKFFYEALQSTINKSPQPLIFINGIESDEDTLKNIKLEQIESFSILKDASATALYGVRAVNGLILVKTKVNE